MSEHINKEISQLINKVLEIDNTINAFNFLCNYFEENKRNLDMKKASIIYNIIDIKSVRENKAYIETSKRLVKFLRNNRNYLRNGKLVQFLFSKIYKGRKSIFNQIDYGKHKGMTDGYYPYISFPEYLFIPNIEWISKNERMTRFIDVGGGIGDKAFLASFYFEKVISLEVSVATSRIARKLYGYCDNRLSIKNMDAFDYDFSNEQLVYLYVPIGNRKIMEKLWLKIFEEIPNGAIILEVGEYPLLIEALEKNNIRVKINLDENPFKIIKKISNKEAWI
jgi:hypothetical protein